MTGAGLGGGAWSRLGAVVVASLVGACGTVQTSAGDGGSDDGGTRAPYAYEGGTGVVASDAGGPSPEAGDAGGGCAALSACCFSVGTGSDYTACEGVVAEHSATACTQALGVFHHVGLCGGTAPTTPIVGCAALGQCCVLLPVSQAAGCDMVVGQAIDGTCTTALKDYQKIGACSDAGVPSSECAALSRCCGFLASNLQTGCKSVVASGSEATCTEDLMLFESHGECN